MGGRVEEYFEVLARLDIPLEKTTTIEAFQEWLAGQMEVTESRLEMFWDAITDYYEQILPMGVRAIAIEYPWGTVTRYAIAREAWARPEEWRPGLWGLERMKEITGWEPE